MHCGDPLYAEKALNDRDLTPIGAERAGNAEDDPPGTAGYCATGRLDAGAGPSAVRGR
jgi:hypothetical protein